MHAGLTWTRWSRLESIEAKNKGVPMPQFSSLKEELNWQDPWAYSIGASYQVNPPLFGGHKCPPYGRAVAGGLTVRRT